MSARIHYLRIQLVLCIFGLFLAIGCAQRQPGGNSAAAPSKLQNPSDEECKAFADKLHTAVIKGDAAEFNKLIDWSAILDRATRNIKCEPKLKAAFIEGFMESLTKSGIPQQIITQINSGGIFKMIHIHQKDHQKRVLFRLMMSTGGASYSDFVVMRQADGIIRAVDIFIFSTSEMISDTIRRPFLAQASEDSKTNLDQLTGKENEWIKHYKEIELMMKSMKNLDYRKSMNMYHQLPAELQKDKSVLILAMNASQRLNNDEYQSIIAVFKSAYPHDSCVDFILIDYYFLRNEYDEALASATRFDKAIGGDAYVKSVCANAFLANRKYSEAQKMAQTAIEIESDFEPAYVTLLTISFRAKNFEESVRLLGAMNEKFDNQYKKLPETSDNAEFLKSPQYREWKENQTAE